MNTSCQSLSDMSRQKIAINKYVDAFFDPGNCSEGSEGEGSGGGQSIWGVPIRLDLTAFGGQFDSTRLHLVAKSTRLKSTVPSPTKHG